MLLRGWLETGAARLVVFLIVLISTVMLSTTIGHAQDQNGVTDPGVESALDESDRALQDPTALDDFFSFKGLIYRQQDTGNGGNPLVDEDTSVIEGILLLRKSISSNDTVHLRLLGDVISAASQREVERNSGMMISGATEIHPFRFDVGGGATHDFGPFDLGISGSFAQEYAYRSHGFGAKSTVRLFENSTLVTLRGQAFGDTVRTIGFDGSVGNDASKETLTGEVGVVQTVTPRSHLNFVYSFTRQRGFLETSFNFVFAGGVQQSEVMPDRRYRQSWTLRYKHAVGETDAIQFGYRFYRDDWGVRAHTADVRYFWMLPSGGVLIEPNYRFYYQSEADFFAPLFATPQYHQTSDSDLGDFTGHSFGVKITWLETELLGVSGDYDVSGNYYYRDDGIELYWATFGIGFPF